MLRTAECGKAEDRSVNGFFTPSQPGSVLLNARRLLEELLCDYSGPVSVRLWNGEIVVGSGGAPCMLTFNQPGPLRELVIRRDWYTLAESFILGLVDVDGDFEAVVSLVATLQKSGFSRRSRLRMMWRAARLPYYDFRDGLGSVANDGKSRANCLESIAHHYDLSNEFYKLWLDPEMTYSCAYFKEESQSLAKAQSDKIDHILRKLRLKPGQTLLDIGCGWGGLAIQAAREYGALAYGITLSERQFSHAVERVQKEGLQDKVKIELKDYRDLPHDQRFDRIVSVGMFEHVGIASFPEYFGFVKRALGPEGLFLNHGITNYSGWNPDPAQRFLNKYVFPDGELTKLSVVINAMEEADFEIFDVENLRCHYTMTLRRWVRSLEENREKVTNLVGDMTYRIWRLYMGASACGFDNGEDMVFQILGGHRGGARSTPLRRDDIYAGMTR
ncbi:Cyclopropane-fatty-acyl-phospholipid synthase [hydrothermal vent metagenome]|uniref:Cyclopropane-fatty-acyl-phospholipid synthase n=1 Tax=hydrothermal vent metagenome TaxID=652676 RepID=A0A3B1CE25_9ZZZZ